MHAATVFLTQSVFSTAIPDNSLSLNRIQASMLKKKLQEDAISCIYSGIITLSESITSTDRKMYSWATVKAYYAVFYFLRSILALNGVAIFHKGMKPFVLLAVEGGKLVSGKSNTHEMVLSEFRKKFQSHWLLTQEIDEKDPLLWIKGKREYSNYTEARFTEPNVPNHFSKISKIGVRRAVVNYIQPENNFLAFDADHAILAYPIQALMHVINTMKGKGNGISFNNDELKYLSTLCYDKNGVIPDFCRIFK